MFKMKNNVFNLALFITAIMLLTSSCTRKSSYSDVDEMISKASKTTEAIGVEELNAKIYDGEMLLLIDVREPMEHNAGYIPGALNIPRGVLEFNIGKADFWEEAMLYMPEKDEPIIVYCKKGSRSILAAQSLEQLGYTQVKYIEGGWKKWEMTYPLLYEKNLDVMPHDDGAEVGGC